MDVISIQKMKDFLYTIDQYLLTFMEIIIKENGPLTVKWVKDDFIEDFPPLGANNFGCNWE